jgi:type I restriction enzyme M protein
MSEWREMTLREAGVSLIDCDHRAHGYVLTPGRYVGAADVEDDGEPFEQKMKRLVADLNGQFAESAKLERAINANLKGLGYEV